MRRDLPFQPTTTRADQGVRPRRPARWPAAVLCGLALCLAAASPALATPAKKAYKEGQAALVRGDFDWAIIYFQRALDLRPEDTDYRRSLDKAKVQASYAHFELAKRHLYGGNITDAIAELQQVVALNPTHQYAYVELEKAVAQWKEEQAARDAASGAMDNLRREADQQLGEVPKLDPKSNIPIQFSMEDWTLKDIFKVVQDVSNINVIFDEGVRLDEKVTFQTDNVSLEQALDLLMLQQALTYKVYDDNTIIVYPDNPTKRREYEDQIIRTFYLSNADVKEVNSLLRTVIDIRKAAVNEELNAITIKDSQDKIAIAGRLIEANDKAKAELVIDLEILEVNRSKLKSWGIDLTTGGAGGINSTVGFDDTQVRLNNLRRLNQLGSYILSPLPVAIVSLVRSDTDTRVLSRPQVRVTDGEKVQVHLGDEVPIPSTTISTNSTVGGNVVPITNFTYQNVGIEIQLEPRIHHNREITLKLNAEISSVTSVNSQGQPTIGSRQVETVIRLRDGEPNLLAGLFQQSTSTGNSGIPGLMDVPFLKKVFGSHDKNDNETEIVLTVTPHIVRVPDITSSDLEPLHVGTEKNTTLRGFSKYGVGGSPFRRGDEVPPPDPFTTLQPGQQARDQDSIVNPDLHLAGDLPDPPPPAPVVAAPAAPLGTSATSPVVTSPPAPAEATVLQPSPGPAPGPAPPPPAPTTPVQPPPSGPPLAPAPTGTAELSLVPSAAAPAVGQTFTVEIRVDTAGHELANAPYHVTFDPARVEMLDAVEGSFFRSAGVQTLFLPSIQPGRVIIGQSRFAGAPSATGAGTLVILTARALRAGPAPFGFDRASLADQTNEALPVRLTGATVNVGP